MSLWFAWTTIISPILVNSLGQKNVWIEMLKYWYPFKINNYFQVYAKLWWVTTTDLRPSRPVPKTAHRPKAEAFWVTTIFSLKKGAMPATPTIIAIAVVVYMADMLSILAKIHFRIHPIVAKV